MRLVQRICATGGEIAARAQSVVSHPSSTRVAVALAAMATVGALACSDGLTRPRSTNSSEDEFRMSGVLVSSLMRADGDAGSPISTLSANATLSNVANRSSVGAPTRILTDPVDASALRAQAAVPFRLSIAALSGRSFDRSGSASRSIVRPRGNGRSFKNRKDGKDYDVQVVNDPRGGNRPPVALVTLINGHAAAVNQYTYTKIGKSWVPSASRSTIYDSTGKPALVSSNTFRTTTLSAASLDQIHPADSHGALNNLVTALGNLVQPDALYAATDGEIDSGCAMKNLAMSLASAAYGVALAGLVSAYTTCALTIVDCPAIVAAQIALGFADVNLGKATAEYYQCLQEQQQQQQQQPTPPPSIGTGGGSPYPQDNQSGPSCGAITWEISYDDGLSWNYLGTTSTC